MKRTVGIMLMLSGIVGLLEASQSSSASSVSPSSSSSSSSSLPAEGSQLPKRAWQKGIVQSNKNRVAAVVESDSKEQVSEERIRSTSARDLTNKERRNLSVQSLTDEDEQVAKLCWKHLRNFNNPQHDHACSIQSLGNHLKQFPIVLRARFDEQGKLNGVIMAEKTVSLIEKMSSLAVSIPKKFSGKTDLIEKVFEALTVIAKHEQDSFGNEFFSQQRRFFGAQTAIGGKSCPALAILLAKDKGALRVDGFHSVDYDKVKIRWHRADTRLLNMVVARCAQDRVEAYWSSGMIRRGEPTGGKILKEMAQMLLAHGADSMHALDVLTMQPCERPCGAVECACKIVMSRKEKRGDDASVVEQDRVAQSVIAVAAEAVPVVSDVEEGVEQSGHKAE